MPNNLEKSFHYLIYKLCWIWRAASKPKRKKNCKIWGQNSKRWFHQHDQFPACLQNIVIIHHLCISWSGRTFLICQNITGHMEWKRVQFWFLSQTRKFEVKVLSLTPNKSSNLSWGWRKSHSQTYVL